MLITPHVIRNREQAQQVTEDFKKSLYTVRNELERIAREREKLQQQPLLEKPPLPGPSGDQPPKPPAPAPAPTAAPAGSAPSGLPLKKINSRSELHSSNTDLNSVRPAEEFETVNAAPMASAFSAVALNPQGMKTAQAQPQPAYALSVTAQPKVTVATPIPKPMSPRMELKSTSLWAVQIAAMERRQDAEALAGVLRNKGYDAYVMQAEVDRKTWHRVRVGHSLARADAAKLQKTLQTGEKFGAAYMISRARKEEE